MAKAKARPARPKTASRASNKKPTATQPQTSRTPLQPFKAATPPTTVVKPTNQTTKPRPELNYWTWLGWYGAGLASVLVIAGVVILISALSVVPSLPPRTAPAAGNAPGGHALSTLAPLTGLPTTQEAAQRRPWAVVVENFPSVRPQHGLSLADLVFESPTEGGITRFLAIFQSHWPDRLGPVRSARSYFNDWARGVGALYSHSGGSDKALKQLRTNPGSLTDVNEFFHGAAYERDALKSPPHNLFTGAARFLSYAQKQGWATTATTLPLNFVRQLPPSGTTGTIVDVPYTPADYRVHYEFEPERGTYQRQVNGTTQADAATSGRVLVTNVVLLYTDITPIPDDPLLRVELRTLGTGEVALFTGGLSYAGIWRKAEPDEPLQLLDSLGSPLPLQPGNTWISVLDKSLKPALVTPSALQPTP